MKKIIIYSIVLLLGIVFNSCNDDILNTKPLDKFSEADVWGDVSLAQGFVYSTDGDVRRLLIYSPDGGDRGAKWEDYSDNTSIKYSNSMIKDLEDKFFDAGWNQVNNGSWNENEYVEEINNISVFGIIRNCNLIIEKAQESEIFNEDEKQYFVAQGKALRALAYWSRARLFGKYIIIDKVLGVNDEFLLPRTSTIKETYDFILNDFKDAAAGLDSTDNSKAGGLNKGAVLAMRAEVALHGAAYIESGKEEYYTIAKEASEELFEMGYSLDSDYEMMFNNYEHSLSSPEILLTYNRHSDVTETKTTPLQTLVGNCSADKNTPVFSNPPLVETIEGWNDRFPSVSLVNDYLVVDEDGVAKFWDETSYYQNFINNGGWVSQAIYKNRDARFEASVVHDSSNYYANLVTIRDSGNMHLHSNVNDGKWAMTHTGYYFRKGIYEDTKLWHADYTPYHQVITRLGRAYLNYAEVMLRLGNTGVAVEYINKTRVAHGALPALDAGLSADEIWDWYKIERRVELFSENDRYWSLLRWGKEDGLEVIEELNRSCKQLDISADGKSFEIFDEQELDAAQSARVFTSKRYLFPVPENERILNPKLDQNPGW